MPHLGIQVQVSLASGAGINGELCRLVHDAASGLQARPKGLHLCRGRSGKLGQGLEEGPLAPSWVHMQVPNRTLSGKQSGTAGWMWAMKGESWMSSSSQMTCTAYSPGSVGQYLTSQEPSPLSSHSILACEGPSMEKPVCKGGKMRGHERQLGHSHHSLRRPSAPLHLIPMLPSIPTSCAPTHFPRPSNIPLPSIRTCYNPATYPVSPPPCRWPPPQSRPTCPPGLFSGRDPRLEPSVFLPLGSPVPQRGWAKRNLASMLGSTSTRGTTLPSEYQVAPHPPPAPLGPRQEGTGCMAYLRGMA